MDGPIDRPCCAPRRPAADAAPRAVAAAGPSRPVGAGGPGDPGARLIALSGGRVRVGNEDDRAIPGDGEGPVRTVEVAPFRIDAHAVSNRRFAAFAAATGHRTLAEREGWSFVFAGHLPEDFPPTRAIAATPWWRQVHGASWRAPEGPGSTIDGRLDHPVVHVTRDDALAFCAWAGLRLPTEVEWEHAARGGLDGARYPWGDELEPGGEHRCNVWQGAFPGEDRGEDGFRGTCPVDAFPANGFGLHEVSGNVWEWTADPWARPGAVLRPAPDGWVAIRGGSHLCHRSYCERYRVAARTAADPASTTGHQGFRCAADA
ncbi:Sulfatase modifying factor 1 precursor (C-alpha-formyglycinee- generating enzyme 1) [Patulibacter medicamentivorans]|uniref:Sulfatase modifying factor 1 (C-alpha-formyglycinee-generating enzyme 1) n=1 Tax=Patulibacter medicamentivorans TaxID=1097667 RepID=H0E6V1_9ACTN|nr:formylglycine-generating enzyme family protein [Patulibacter medicamentivorans]EHN10592.1 Sulfatase modifying factor 1 precursor (C-alpha-formyglycinee- generating enzyme 1) [Patulibacter medicamentivorans]